MNIEDLSFTKAVVIKSECKMWQMPSVMNKNFIALQEFLKEHGKSSTLPPFTKYTNFCWDDLLNQSKFKMFIEMFTRTWYFETGIPVDEDLPQTESIVMQDYAPTKVASAMHLGPYYKVSDTYKALCQDALNSQVKFENVSFELYLNDPRVTPKEQLETKILVPLSI